MVHGERLTGGRFVPHVQTRPTRFHAVQRGSRWAFCGCMGVGLLHDRFGIKGSRMVGRIRTNKACYPIYKQDIPVYAEWQ